MNATPLVTTTVAGVEAPTLLPAPEPHPPADAAGDARRRRATRRGERRAPFKPAHPGYKPRPETEQKRHRIMQTAATLWAEQGMPGYSVRAIAGLAGVYGSMVYYVLGNREDILAEILDEHVIALRGRVSAAAHASIDQLPQARLEALLTAYLEGAAAEPHAHFLLQHAMAFVKQRGREALRLRYRTLLALLCAPLAQVAPSLDGDAAAVLALAAVGSAGDALLWFDPKQTLEVRATARRLTAMLLVAVGSADGPGPRPGCGGPTEACARAWLAVGAGQWER